MCFVTLYQEYVPHILYTQFTCRLDKDFQKNIAEKRVCIICAGFYVKSKPFLLCLLKVLIPYYSVRLLLMARI